VGALDGPDFETTRQQLVAFGATRAPDLGTSPVEFLGEQAGAQAQWAQTMQSSVGQAGADAVPSSDSSDTGLKTWAVSIGLSNGAGSYGARGATAASGATGQLTGDKGTAYLAGQLAQAPGGVRIVLRDNVTIAGAPPGTGQVDGVWDVDATDAGSLGAVGNLLAGARCTLIGAPAGSDASFVLTAGMAVLGTDAETTPHLLDRVQAKMQRPPNGGNGTDYKGWAEDARDTSDRPVTSAQIVAYVYTHYYGVGSPMICATAVGSGVTRKPGAAVATAISDYITGSTSREGQRPASHDCIVLEPYMPAERALVIRCRCVPSLTKYFFDWVRGATSYTVSAFATAGLPAFVTAAGGNAMLTLDKLAPASLKDAIAAGNQPRIQVHMVDGTGALYMSVVPEQALCLAYNDNAGLTELALRVTNAPVWQASVFGNNEVYSGGPIVSLVGAAILAAIDERGPSRVSGLYDPAQLWQDTVNPSTISTAAETTLDEDQLTRLVDHCITGGVLIGIGGLAVPTVQDIQASDTTILGPELLYAGRILVTD
jgi:hypothetical protein